MNDELNAALIRIERLERQNRRFKQAGAAVLMLVGAAIAMGQARSPRTIEAERFILRDAQGRPRIEIGTPRFSGAAVGLASDEPAIWIMDEKGQARTSISADYVGLATSQGKPLADLQANSDAGASLNLFGANGKLRWSAP